MRSLPLFILSGLFSKWSMQKRSIATQSGFSIFMVQDSILISSLRTCINLAFTAYPADQFSIPTHEASRGYSEFMIANDHITINCTGLWYNWHLSPYIGIISKLNYTILQFHSFLPFRILKAAQFQFLYRVENSYCTSWVLIIHPPYFIEDLVNFSFTVYRNFWLFSRVNLVWCKILDMVLLIFCLIPNHGFLRLQQIFLFEYLVWTQVLQRVNGVGVVL